MFLFAVVSLCAVGYAAQEVIKRASDDPCGKCNIANENRKCGKCGGFLSNYKTESKQIDKYKVEYWFYYQCKVCGHQCMHKERR